MDVQTTLTAKAVRSRDRILDAALTLFAEKGYEETTMRDIAAAADASLGLAYRYFDSKEHLVLALYQRLATQLEDYEGWLREGTVAERFELAVRTKLALLAPHKAAFGALAGAALTPGSDVAVMGDTTQSIGQQVEAIFRTVVAGATDAPAEPQRSQLARLLYLIHLGVLLCTENRPIGAANVERHVAS